MTRFIPVGFQAFFWLHWCKIKHGKKSAYKLEAIKRLRKSAGLTLKDAKRHIDRFLF